MRFDTTLGLARSARPPRRSITGPVRSLLLLMLGATLSALLTGCAPVLIGGVAVGAAATWHDRRSYDVIFDDQQIELAAQTALLRDSAVRGQSRIAVTSFNRTVLLTGQADSTEIAKQAAEIVSRVTKVQRVIDEVTVGPSIGLSRQTEDVSVTARVKTALINVRLSGFDPTRVKVVIENAVVYLMGLVTPAEAEAATEEVRYVPGVERVVRLFEYIDEQA